MMMKRIVGGLGLVLLMVLAGSAMGEVVATARSSEGAFPEFRVVLDAVGQPVAVANFMGLADGSRTWVDPTTGWVRGGAEDTFYGETGFDWCDEESMRGGSRGVEGEGGAVSYTGGPGYTVLGKTNEVWSAIDWGTLALVEQGGPHSGGSEVILYLAGGMTPWTVFGAVPKEDEAGLRGLHEAVNAASATGGVVAVRWKVDAERATAEELSALESARARLPVAAGLESRVTDGGFQWDWPGRSRLWVFACDDLTAGLKAEMTGWRESAEARPMEITWESLGVTGDRGFGAVTCARYPTWSGAVPSGKCRMGMDHSGMRIQYWFDFDGRTGMMARVESGIIVERAAIQSLLARREFGNVWEVFFSTGKAGTYYELGVVEEGALGGRFMSLQIPGGTDWGMFEMAEGWGEETSTAKSRKQKGKRKTVHGGFENRWVEWGNGKGGWRPEGIRLPEGVGREKDAKKGMK